MVNKFPPYLAASTKDGSRIFVLATPNLCALCVDGTWQYTEPLPDSEISKYELITDIVTAQKLIKEAKRALNHPEVS